MSYSALLRAVNVSRAAKNVALNPKPADEDLEIEIVGKVDVKFALVCNPYDDVERSTGYAAMCLTNIAGGWRFLVRLCSWVSAPLTAIREGILVRGGTAPVSRRVFKGGCDQESVVFFKRNGKESRGVVVCSLKGNGEKACIKGT